MVLLSEAKAAEGQNIYLGLATSGKGRKGSKNNVKPKQSILKPLKFWHLNL
jgi:hypothetical protein